MTSFSSSKNIPRNIVVLLTLLVTVVAASIGYYVGAVQTQRAATPEGEGQIFGIGQVPSHLSEDVDFALFWNIWNLIKEQYYQQPVSDKELFYGSLKGLLIGLDDPYSVFLDPEEAQEFAQNLEGSFEGIGAEIGIRDDKLQIVSPLEGSPAEKAGLLPGDWIVMIDGVETLGMSVEEAVTHIRGEHGTTVTLSISRDGLEALEEFVITRDKIVIDSVKWRLDEKTQMMLISISTFNGDTTTLMNEAVQEALAKNARGIVLDLRSNPGGYLTSAIDIASLWVGYQPVVIEKTWNDATTFKGTMAPRLEGMKTVVLINEGSASASEIVSGALKDYERATLVGKTTFGKGSVQDYRELEDGSAVKMTTALWYTPRGRSIHEVGISPDIEVDFTLEQFKQGIDPQKEVALAVLLGTYEPQEPSDAQTTEKTSAP